MLKAPSNSGFHEVYASNETSAWVDCGTQGHTLWQILPQDNGYYRIKIVDQDALYGLSSANAVTMNGMWGIDGVESTIVHPFIDHCRRDTKTQKQTGNSQNRKLTKSTNQENPSGPTGKSQ